MKLYLICTPFSFETIKHFIEIQSSFAAEEIDEETRTLTFESDDADMLENVMTDELENACLNGYRFEA